ncbi:unnamed protein product [Phytophthora fragariaefolia]|uniref:Unnamed protein product n=1 Tax=Phytophthora fragariaefolia TaxID=1490495 RepID=A0A9W6XG67_9STRA|nr:unnamed protein product [Phytophthora fragariaefolia]
MARAQKRMNAIAGCRKARSYYDHCSHDIGVATHVDLLNYCRNNIAEFALANEKSQSTWIRRFMGCYWSRYVFGGPRGDVEQPLQNPHDNEAISESPDVHTTMEYSPRSVNAISDSNHHKNWAS